VIALDNPSTELRPGLSCTSKITTATRKNALTIPIQALTVRQKGDLEPAAKDGKAVQAATKVDAAARRPEGRDPGRFLDPGRAGAVPQSGHRHHGRHRHRGAERSSEGEEIVTGSYKVIRTIRNETKVKIDNAVKAPVKTD